MKVLFVAEVDLDGKSGQNIATNQVVSALSKDQRVELILICPKPILELDEAINSIKKKYFLPTRKAKSIFWHVKYQFFLVRALINILRNEKSEHIITRLGTSTFITPIFAWLFKKNYILLVRGLPDFRKESKIPGIYYYGQFLFYINSSVASKVYVAYSEIKQKIDSFRKGKEHKSMLLTNAVDTDRFFPVDKNLARREINISLKNDDFVIGFAGSIKKRHCLQELIDAIEQVKKKINVKVLIIGEGPELDNLMRVVAEKKLEEIIFFTGFIPHTNLNNYISSCDVLYGAIHPELVENPIKCYEYLACGRPIITTQKEEMEFVSKEGLGVILRDLSSEEISKGILEIHSYSKSTLMMLEKKSREYILKNHTWTKFADTIINDL